MDSGSGDTQNIVVPVAKQRSRRDCVLELGYALIYMKWLNPGWLDGSPATTDQHKRVETLCMELAVNWHRVGEHDCWWESLFIRIIDETENMC